MSLCGMFGQYSLVAVQLPSSRLPGGSWGSYVCTYINSMCTIMITWDNTAARTSPAHKQKAKSAHLPLHLCAFSSHTLPVRCWLMRKKTSPTPHAPMCIQQSRLLPIADAWRSPVIESHCYHRPHNSSGRVWPLCVSVSALCVYNRGTLEAY